jgi:hypothetical protein
VCFGPRVQLEGSEERDIEAGHKEMVKGAGVEPSVSARASYDGQVDDTSDCVTQMDIDTTTGYEKEALADDSAMVDDFHADLTDVRPTTSAAPFSRASLRHCFRVRELY